LLVLVTRGRDVAALFEWPDHDHTWSNASYYVV
jgi:hypothetical protein